MQQGPIPTQLCCGTSKLGGARLTRMKESHEVYEIRQGSSDQRHRCCGRPQHYVLRRELYSRLFVCDGYRDESIQRQWNPQRLSDRPQHRETCRDQRAAGFLRRRQPGSRRTDYRKPIPLCPEPGHEFIGRVHLHHRRSLPKREYHGVRGGRRRHPFRPANLLYPGHQPLPAAWRPDGKLPLRTGP